MRIKRGFHILLMITVCCASVLCSSSCAWKKQGSDYINSQIKVFNMALFADADNGAVNGVAPRREPCINGYEFYYDDLDMVVSYHHDNRIWRITTRNKNTTMFGIAPGESFLQAKDKIMRLGFSQGYTPYKFIKDWCLFTLLVDEKNNVFGMTVEILD